MEACVSHRSSEAAMAKFETRKGVQSLLSFSDFGRATQSEDAREQIICFSSSCFSRNYKIAAKVILFIIVNSMFRVVVQLLSQTVRDCHGEREKHFSYRLIFMLFSAPLPLCFLYLSSPNDVCWVEWRSQPAASPPPISSRRYAKFVIVWARH